MLQIYNTNYNKMDVNPGKIVFFYSRVFGQFFYYFFYERYSQFWHEYLRDKQKKYFE